MPPRNTLFQPLQCSAACDLQKIEAALENALKEIHGATLTVAANNKPPIAQVYILQATQNTWSRSARRQQRHGQSLDLKPPNPPSDTIGMVCSVNISQELQTSEDASQEQRRQATGWTEELDRMDEGQDMNVDDEFWSGPAPQETQLFKSQHIRGRISLVFQWLAGEDRAMFESFVSHVGRKVGAAMLLVT